MGADAVAMPAPDGYSILLLLNSCTINTSIYRNLSRDLLRDLAPIGRCATSVQVACGVMAAFDAVVNQGRLRALPVTTAVRSLELPDVPTISESGLPGFDVGIWYETGIKPLLNRQRNGAS
jgi:tripartite-type tricarboxylate transporter receptor subunit TctC